MEASFSELSSSPLPYFLFSTMFAAQIWDGDNRFSLNSTLGYNIDANLPHFYRRFNGTDDPQLGAEIGYARRVLQFGNDEKPVTFGIESTFGVTELEIGTHSLAKGAFTVTFGGVGGPPPGQYNTQHTLSAKLNGQLYSFNLGPFFEIPLCKKASFALSGGLSVLGAHTEFSLRRTDTVFHPTPETYARADQDSENNWLLGGYVKATVIVRIAEDWQALAGVEYRKLGRFSQKTGVSPESARLDLSEPIFLSLGIGYSF